MSSTEEAGYRTTRKVAQTKRNIVIGTISHRLFKAPLHPVAGPGRDDSSVLAGCGRKGSPGRVMISVFLLQFNYREGRWTRSIVFGVLAFSPHKISLFLKGVCVIRLLGASLLRVGGLVSRGFEV